MDTSTSSSDVPAFLLPVAFFILLLLGENLFPLGKSTRRLLPRYAINPGLSAKGQVRFLAHHLA